MSSSKCISFQCVYVVKLFCKILAKRYVCFAPSRFLTVTLVFASSHHLLLLFLLVSCAVLCSKWISEHWFVVCMTRIKMQVKKLPKLDNWISKDGVRLRPNSCLSLLFVHGHFCLHVMLHHLCCTSFLLYRLCYSWCLPQ